LRYNIWKGETVDFVTLGRTGLRASVIGLGGGGPSRLGQSTGHSESDSVNVVRRGLDLGINFFDTAEGYGTEPIMAEALAGIPRDRYILSTKKGSYRNNQPVSAADMVAGVEAALRRLNVDAVDIFHLHGVRLTQYDHAINEIAPAMLKLKEQGKIRFLGITENFSTDTKHAMLQRALQDDCWDVTMVGFNLLNQTARHTVFPTTIAKDVGVLIMFAVRRALSDPQQLRELIQGLINDGLLDVNALDPERPLDFLIGEGGAESVVDAAYRYCRYEPGVHVVLSGTGNPAHLEQNVQSLMRPPLKPAAVQHIHQLFGAIDTVSGN
jgi:aryl-alcohol dehydrogenase-like predicted oxidoreductase